MERAYTDGHRTTKERNLPACIRTLCKMLIVRTRDDRAMSRNSVVGRTFRSNRYDAIHIVLPAVLLAAVALKAHHLATEPVISTCLLHSRPRYRLIRIWDVARVSEYGENRFGRRAESLGDPTIPVGKVVISEPKMGESS